MGLVLSEPVAYPRQPACGEMGPARQPYTDTRVGHADGKHQSRLDPGAIVRTDEAAVQLLRARSSVFNDWGDSIPAPRLHCDTPDARTRAV